MTLPPPPPVPAWLVPWSVWMIRGKVDPRPADAPDRIPEWAIWFPGWVKWRMSGQPAGARPAKAPTPIPDWAWIPATATIRAVNKENSLTFWRRMGVWVTIPAHISPEQIETLCGEQYGYVCVPTLFGTQPDAWTEDLESYIDRCRDLGFDVVGSQWGAALTVEEAQVEAEAGAAAYKFYGFDGWAMNGEKKYEGGGRSGAYAQRFRQKVGYSVPFLWSPEPRLSLDHDILQACGVAYGPQAYPLENGKNVNYVAEWGENFGYESKNVIPLVQAYESPSGERYPAEEYARQARVWELPALILYPGNQAVGVPSYWRDLVV